MNSIFIFVNELMLPRLAVIFWDFNWQTISLLCHWREKSDGNSWTDSFMFILEFSQIMAYHFLSHFKSSLPLFVQCSFVLARVKLLSPLIRILSFHFPFFYSDFSSANLAVAIIISNFQSKYNNISDLCVCANDANNRRASVRQIFCSTT